MPTHATLDRSKFPTPAEARRRALAAIRATTIAFAWEIKRHMMAEMRAPKHGRAYRRPGGRVHIASAPGEAPAVDTGALIRSLDVRVHNRPAGTQAEAGTPLLYGAYLDQGTKDGRILPRPFIEPAATAHHQPFVDALRRNVVDAIAGTAPSAVLPVTPF